MDWSFKKVFRYECLTVILIVFFSFVFDFCPQMTKIVILERGARKARQSIKTMSKFEQDRIKKRAKQELIRMERNYDLIKKTVGEIKGGVKGSKNVPLVTIALEDFAASAKIEMASIRPLDTQLSNTYTILPIEVGFQAEHAKASKFLYEIENSEIPMVVSDLHIRKDEEIYPLLDISLTLNVLFFSEEDSLNDDSE